MQKLHLLEKILGYKFKDINLLHFAMMHPSYANENNEKQDNQRLEFLGDSVLGLVITEILYNKYPDNKEGKLSKVKSFLVSKDVLADLARKVKINEFILLGVGEASSGGVDKLSNLEDAFEAMIGAIYLDSGLASVKDLLENLFESIINNMEEDVVGKNYKGYLQEVSQEIFNVVPQYNIIKLEGEEHEKIFTVEVNILDKYKATGVGKSKKEAEKKSAQKVLAELADKKIIKLNDV
jgi:ribonuclease III